MIGSLFIVAVALIFWVVGEFVILPIADRVFGDHGLTDDELSEERKDVA